MLGVNFGAATDVDVNKYPVITYVEAVATSDTTTTSATDSLLNSMTITPLAGVYQVWFSTSGTNSSNGGITYYSVYVGGTQVASSERRVTSLIAGIVIGNAPNEVAVATQALVSVNGSQAIEIRWRRSAGTSTTHQRTLTVIKLASI